MTARPEPDVPARPQPSQPQAPPAEPHPAQPQPHPARPQAPPHSTRRPRLRARWIAIAVAVPVALLVAVLATSPPAGTRAANSPLLGKPAPPLDATSIDGAEVRLADLGGKWVLVNFFATWCVPCRQEHDDLVRFAQRHQTSGDAEVVGVIYDDTAGAVREFRDDEGGSWPMLVDANGRIALDFGVSGVPESYVISPDGIVSAKIVGGIQDAALEELLAKVRAGRRP